jgi:hypothetical protein
VFNESQILFPSYLHLILNVHDQRIHIDCGDYVVMNV